MIIFILNPSFYVGSRIRYEKMFGSGIRDGKFSDPDPGFGIKHPVSAALVKRDTVPYR
jgi:hypothetical protein